MAPIDLNLARAFVAVHETGSFSAAGQRLGVPRSTVSRAIASFEAALGMTLFHRTTRKVTTTEAGTALHGRLASSLADVEASLADAPEDARAPAGLLRVTSTVDIGMSLLSPVIARFTARYPRVRVELHTSDEIQDLTRDSFDLAVRIASGPLPGGAAFMVQKVGQIQIRLFASPSYFARRGVPRTPADLRTHDWVHHRLYDAPAVPVDARGATKKPPAPRVTCNDIFTLREMLRDGAGIGRLADHFVAEDVAEGRLVPVLPSWFRVRATVHLVFPSGRHLPPKVTLFRELLAEQLRKNPLQLVPAG
jgi:DNA-binding transcriptional LysR family regulator